jgi:hypothetical protein
LQSPARRKYTYAEKLLPGQSVEQKMNYVTDFKINKSFQNPMTAMSGGMYSGTLITHDITRKVIEKTVFNYRKDFEKRNHLGKYPLVQKNIRHQDEKDVILEKPYRAETSSIYLYPKHKGLHTGLDNSNNVENWLMNGNSQMQEITAISATAIIPGDISSSSDGNGLVIGDVIEFDLQIFQEGKERIVNPYIAGRYMIVNLTHEFNLSEYQIKVDVVKDGFDTNIDESLTASSQKQTSPNTEAE